MDEPLFIYDVMYRLTQYMDLNSLTTMAQTSAEYMHIARTIFKLKFQSKLKLYSETNLNAIWIFGDLAKRVSINEYSSNYFDEDKMSKTLQKLEKYCDQVQSLHVPVDNEKIVRSHFFRTAVSRITRLKLYMSCRREFSVYELLEALQYCPFLTILKISFCCGITCGPLFNMTAPKLEKLQITDNSLMLQRNATYDALRGFIVRHPNLESFDLTALNTEAMLTTLSEFRSLDYMKLTFSRGTVIHGDLALKLRKLPALRDLYFECNVEEVDIKDLIQIPQVESLRLSFVWSNHMDYKRFMEILRFHQNNLQNLVEIALPNFRMPNKPTHKQLKKMFPKLGIIVWNWEFLYYILLVNLEFQ